jgi:D-alanyl-D-alanine carboxypeptidase
VTALALSLGDADARRKKKRIGHAKPPPFSHIVLDAKTGKTLEAFNADDKRYPASLTKVMTLYLLFEQIEAGKLTLSSEMEVSRYAASRPPTKLGLKPGAFIRVDDAIKALVTKSANDAAVVVAESIAGSEEEFARMMTSKALALGMQHTTYANASGLPNPNQVTTARDQAILGRAIQWHFPRHYKYFATNSFHFRGREIHTHNRLLGQVRGVDGIKTGYTHASGFNLVTSVRRDRRHIVAVVIGGRTSRSRDAFMRKLIKDYIDDASPVRTAQPPARAVIEASDLPTPPERPAPPEIATEAAVKLALLIDSVKPVELVQIGGTADRPDNADPATTASIIRPSVTAAAAPRRVAIESARTAPLARNALVVADASLSRSVAPAVFAEPVDVVTVVVRSGLPGFLGWFPYLLVVLIGCAGVLLAVFLSAVPPRPRDGEYPR